MSHLSISVIFNQSWSLFKANWMTLVGLFLLFILVSLIPFIGSLLSGLIFGPALSMAALLAARRGQVAFGEAFSNIGRLLLVFVYQLILFAVPILLSFLPFFYAARESFEYAEPMITASPGIVIMSVMGGILALIMSIWGWSGFYFILDGKKGVFGALSASFSTTTQNIGSVILAFLLLIGINILGAFACGLGLIVTMPLSFVFLALLYLRLTEGTPHSLA